MTPPRKPPFQFGLAALFGAITVAAAVALIARDGNSASLWGPLLILGEAIHNPLAFVLTCLLILVLIGAMASFPVKPTTGTAVLACVAALVWLLLGALGIAMGDQSSELIHCVASLCGYGFATH